MHKRQHKQYILPLALLAFVAIILCALLLESKLKLTSWLYQEWYEHYPYKHIKVAKTNGIPRIYLWSTNINTLSKEKWTKGTFILNDKDGKELLSGNLKIKGRGNTTWRMPKKPFALKFENKVSLFGSSLDTRYNLLNCYSDKTLLRTDFAMYLGSNIYTNLAWTPKVFDIEVVFNGKYIGFYNLIEKPRVDSNKIDINLMTKKHKDGGFLLDIGRVKEEPWFYLDSKTYVQIEEPNTNVSDKMTASAKNKTQHLENVIFGKVKGEDYKDLINIDSLVDWYIVNEFTKNEDAAFKASVFVYYDDADCKFHFGPLWDFDISCGNCDFDGQENPQGFWVNQSLWLQAIYKDKVFVKAVCERWQQTKDSLYYTINTYLRERATKIQKAQECNFKTWHILGINVWPNYFVGETYEEELEYLIQWLNARYSWLDAQWGNAHFD